MKISLGAKNFPLAPGICAEWLGSVDFKGLLLRLFHFDCFEIVKKGLHRQIVCDKSQFNGLVQCVIMYQCTG